MRDGSREQLLFGGHAPADATDVDRGAPQRLHVDEGVLAAVEQRGRVGRQARQVSVPCTAWVRSPTRFILGGWGVN